MTLKQEERVLYDKIVAQCNRDMDELVSSRAKIKKYGILFKMMMELRRLCNHGTLAAPSTTDLSPETGPDLENDQGCEFCSGADEDRFELVNQDNICSECGRELLPMTSSQAPAPEVTLGFGEAISRRNVPSPKEVSDTKMSEAISAKIQAVINRLSRIEYGSKR